jgi:hypothetical protein
MAFEEIWILHDIFADADNFHVIKRNKFLIVWTLRSWVIKEVAGSENSNYRTDLSNVCRNYDGKEPASVSG